MKKINIHKPNCIIAAREIAKDLKIKYFKLMAKV